MVNPASTSMVGILAVQGSFSLHVERLIALNIPNMLVRTPQELEACQLLILPGGESTSMLKMIDFQNLWDPLIAFGQKKPMIGICAGAILMAEQVKSPTQPSLGLVSIIAERNSYGRQKESAELDLTPVHPDMGQSLLPGVFIRAPRLLDPGPNVQILVQQGQDVVCVRQGHHIAMSYHPELCADWEFYYRYFFRACSQIFLNH